MSTDSDANEAILRLRQELLDRKQQLKSMRDVTLPSTPTHDTEAPSVPLSNKTELLKARLAEKKRENEAAKLAAALPSKPAVVPVPSSQADALSREEAGFHVVRQHRNCIGTFARTQGLTLHYRTANHWADRVRMGFKVEPMQDDSTTHIPIYWRPARPNQRTGALMDSQLQERNTRRNKRARVDSMNLNAFKDVILTSDTTTKFDCDK